ncbi:Tol-Pal system beta propeller repeat protein TolB [Amylibacter sp. IMCC11727]|uniref:Tol-Pal system beta propeller repeat protein TolB n=1 Tax=Amylibacter sp. IMCC11727 TaxID=3039851 RepID=UPI00244DF4B8|nr:Tol-Pal system beta propeller repeat protein TolB [Amylibacter sp. IMCC11727]WGI22838.1 Tol-Pal system beta propeller repeat protein TolB [Amylibacter sp. IMCC11727]
MMKQFLKLMIAAVMLGVPAQAQENGPLRIEITEGIIEPMPIAIPGFVAENAGAEAFAQQLTQVVTSDLVGSGLFRNIDPAAYIGSVTNFNAPVSFPDWKAINAQALITGAVSLTDDNQMVVKFRLFDVFGQETLLGLQFAASSQSWRRMSHKVADQVYARLTGEDPYFDSRVVYIAEEGPKNDRKKRLAVMDYDGANTRYLTGSDDIVLAPRFSPNAREIIYTSYETGVPQVFLMNVDTLSRRVLDSERNMTFAPRFSPDGRKVVMSLSSGAKSDLYSFDIATGQKTQLTNTSAIDTAPSYSPDGSQIVFESDRGGGQQIYVMPANGGPAQRISFGTGRYGTPVWSPRGDMIAFTNISGGRFHIGVMRTDGSQEKLLTGSFLDEGPTWSPNGRVIMFFRETQGSDGAPSLFSVDVTGQFLKKVATPTFGSDPAWSGLLE